MARQDIVVGARVPRDIIMQLDEIAAEWQVTRADVLRHAVSELLESRTLSAGKGEMDPERIKRLAGMVGAR